MLRFLNSLFNRVITAFRVMFATECLYIEVSWDKKKKMNRVSLWTNRPDAARHGAMFLELGKSLEYDAQKEEEEKSRTFDGQSN